MVSMRGVISRSSWPRIGKLTDPRFWDQELIIRPDTLDPALLRPGRLDRKIEFSLPDNEGRTHILKIHGKRLAIVSTPHDQADNTV
jgi:hypothetical protein